MHGPVKPELVLSTIFLREITWACWHTIYNDPAKVWKVAWPLTLKVTTMQLDVYLSIHPYFSAVNFNVKKLKSAFGCDSTKHNNFFFKTHFRPTGLTI